NGGADGASDKPEYRIKGRFCASFARWNVHDEDVDGGDKDAPDAGEQNHRAYHDLRERRIEQEKPYETRHYDQGGEQQRILGASTAHDPSEQRTGDQNN